MGRIHEKHTHTREYLIHAHRISAPVRVRYNFFSLYDTVGVVDPNLTDCGIVLPGMGDVGDRLFGTGNHDFEEDVGGGLSSDPVDEEQPPTKRKRSASLSLEMDLTNSNK